MPTPSRLHFRKIGDEPNSASDAQSAPEPQVVRPVVLFDCRLIGESGGGFTTYQTHLASALHAEREHLSWRPVLLLGEKGVSRLERLGLHGAEFLETDLEFLSPRELFIIPQLIRQAKADLWVSTTFSSLLPWGMRCPWLIAIHDLNHLKWGSYAKKIYYRYILRPFARRAAKVLTVSEFSKRELVGWLKLPREGVTLARNAIDGAPLHQFSESEILGGLKRYQLKRHHYFLALTNPKPHKNAELLIRAWREWADWVEERGEEPIPLVVSFPAPPEGGVNGVQYIGGLNSRDASILLASAHTLFFPSLYEGFGLPPVEAILSGTPVCVSAIPPHREALEGVPGECIRWVTEPGSRAAWVAAFEAVAKVSLQRPGGEERVAIQERYHPKHLLRAWRSEIEFSLSSVGGNQG
jgi:glycosyltransferase involved in cell wall biosynthesis